MRFTVFHCHNPACGHRVWVPLHRLGTRGKCPECGAVLTIPDNLPEDQFFEGPDVLEEMETSEASVGIAQDMREFA